MGVLKNEFSWSRSREELFKECRRKYYFHYYGSWGGWEHESDPRTREIYMLKNLKTRSGWAGLVIQDAIQEAVRSMRESEGGLFADHESFIGGIIQAMRNDFKSSMDGVYRRSPKTTGLVEHEYKLPVENSVWKANADHVAQCLRNFFKSSLATRIASASPGDFLEFKKFDTVTIEGTKVFATPEICFRSGPDCILGAPRSSEQTPEVVRLKIACQILFLELNRDIAPSAVKAIDLNLKNGTQEELEFSPEELAQVRERIKNSAAEMRGVLNDPAANTAREQDFPVSETDEPCAYCGFRRTCSRFEAEYSGRNSEEQDARKENTGGQATDASVPAQNLKGIKAL